MRRSASSGLARVADAGLAGQAAALRGLDDQPRQALAPAAVEAVGLGVFVDQPLELARVAGQIGADERRRQMAERHRGDPALGLRRLARIADDERIDHRQRPDHGLGKQAAVSATALPGSHSSVPCAPMWTMASTLATWRSHSPKASSAWRGGKDGS